MRDLAAAYDVMQGPDAADPVCADRPTEACLPRLEEGIGDYVRGYLSQPDPYR